MQRFARLAVSFLFALCAWSWAVPAFAAGALCDEVGASSIAPTPHLVASSSQAALDVPSDDPVLVEPNDVMSITHAHHGVVLDDGGGLHAVVRSMRICIAPLAVVRVGDAFASSASPRGVRNSLERPPRA